MLCIANKMFVKYGILCFNLYANGSNFMRACTTDLK